MRTLYWYRWAILMLVTSIALASLDVAVNRPLGAIVIGLFSSVGMYALNKAED